MSRVLPILAGGVFFGIGIVVAIDVFRRLTEREAGPFAALLIGSTAGAFASYFIFRWCFFAWKKFTRK